MSIHGAIKHLLLPHTSANTPLVLRCFGFMKVANPQINPTFSFLSCLSSVNKLGANRRKWHLEARCLVVLHFCYHLCQVNAPTVVMSYHAHCRNQALACAATDVVKYDGLLKMKYFPFYDKKALGMGMLKGNEYLFKKLVKSLLFFLN